jgi:hypothetical protein
VNYVDPDPDAPYDQDESIAEQASNEQMEADQREQD